MVASVAEKELRRAGDVAAQSREPVPLVPPPPCNRTGLFSVMLPLSVCEPWLLLSGAIAGNEAKRRRQAGGIVRSVIDDDVAPHDRARRRAGEAERKGSC